LVKLLLLLRRRRRNEDDDGRMARREKLVEARRLGRGYSHCRQQRLMHSAIYKTILHGLTTHVRVGRLLCFPTSKAFPAGGFRSDPGVVM
jgi:hypothetical protein